MLPKKNRDKEESWAIVFFRRLLKREIYNYKWNSYYLATNDLAEKQDSNHIIATTIATQLRYIACISLNIFTMCFFWAYHGWWRSKALLHSWSHTDPTIMKKFWQSSDLSKKDENIKIILLNHWFLLTATIFLLKISSFL